MRGRISTRGAVLLSVCVALLLAAVPLPEALVAYQPLWPVMVLLYWIVMLSGKVSYVLAILLGLCMDVQQGVLLGQNMLSLAVVIYVGGRACKTMRLAPLSMQTIVAGFIFTCYLFCNWLVSVATGLPPIHINYWLPAASSAILWPLVFSLLSDLRRRVVVP